MTRDTQRLIILGCIGVAVGWMCLGMTPRGAALEKLLAQQQRQVTGGGAAWSPSEISGMLLWLDASAITGATNNEPLAIWDDLSTNGWDATQSSGAARPTYITNGINGKVSVLFGGGTIQLVGTNTLVGAVSNSITAIVVYLDDRRSATWSVMFANGSSAGQCVGALSTYVADTNVIFYNVASYSADGPVKDQPEVMLCSWNGVTRKMWRNETSATLGSSTEPVGTPEGYYSVGSDPYGSGFLGKLAEVIVYDNEISDTNRSLVTTYLLNKWGIVP